MRLRASIHSFSLIELLTALSILALVAGIIIPRYLGVLDQAKQAVIDNNLVEVSHAVQMWEALGGIRAAVPGNYEAYNLLKFLSTPSDGTPQRNGGVADTSRPTDAGTSSTVTVSAVMGGIVAPTAASTDGYYGKGNTTGQAPSDVNGHLYVKSGNKVYPIECNDLATAIFIRTGTAPGEAPVTPGTL